MAVITDKQEGSFMSLDETITGSGLKILDLTVVVVVGSY